MTITRSFNGSATSLLIRYDQALGLLREHIRCSPWKVVADDQCSDTSERGEVWGDLISCFGAIEAVVATLENDGRRLGMGTRKLSIMVTRPTFSTP